MMHERGLSIEQTTLFRWGQRYAPEINKRMREGIESLQMMRKGQVKRLDSRDAIGQAKFVASRFYHGGGF
jgi:hypothetical protein